jgi:hypothetical protein
MTGGREDTQTAHLRGGSDAAAPGPEGRDRIVQRWRDLREMLTRQLDMFETGALTLRSNDVNISAAAIADLKRSIGEFDALISRPD